MSAHVYKFVGPKDSQLENSVAPGITVTGGAVAPIVKRVWTLSDDSAKEDIDGALANLGWVPAEDDTMPVITIQASRIRLSADGPAILPAAGWANVITRTLTTPGNTMLVIDAAFIAAVSLGGEVRVVIDGGEFSDLVLHESVALPLLSGAEIVSWHGSIALPVEDPAVTYTVKLQAQAAALGSVTPQMGSSLEIEELSA